MSEDITTEARAIWREAYARMSTTVAGSLGNTSYLVEPARCVAHANRAAYDYTIAWSGQTGDLLDLLIVGLDNPGIVELHEAAKKRLEVERKAAEDERLKEERLRARLCFNAKCDKPVGKTSGDFCSLDCANEAREWCVVCGHAVYNGDPCAHCREARL